MLCFKIFLNIKFRTFFFLLLIIFGQTSQRTFNFFSNQNVSRNSNGKIQRKTHFTSFSACQRNVWGYHFRPLPKSFCFVLFSSFLTLWQNLIKLLPVQKVTQYYPKHPFLEGEFTFPLTFIHKNFHLSIVLFIVERKSRHIVSNF